MKSFKTLFTVGCFVLAFIGAMIIQNSNVSRTVDFRGNVMDVIVSDSGVITLHAEALEGGDRIFRIDESSRLENLDGEKISVGDLKVGTLIDLNYKKPLFKDEDVYTVKELVAYD